MSFNGVLNTILIAFIAFGMYSALAGADNPEGIIQTIKDDPAKGLGSAACYGIASTSVSPALQVEWFPWPNDTLIPILEDIPFPDGIDFLWLGLWVVLTLFILRLTILKPGAKAKQYLISGLVILAVIILAWIVLKIIMFFLLYACGQTLGLSSEAITAGRQEAISAMSNTKIIIPLLFLSIFTGASTLRGMIWGKKE